ncbi:MAG: MlaA family lipoprotein [Paracoccaceae bacterium]
MKLPGSVLVLVVLAATLAGCGPAPVAQGINDPFEESNRRTHATNKALDRAIVRPVSVTVAGSNGKPGPVGRVVANFADNLDEPGRVVNSLLQFRIGEAAQSTLRFAFNSTFGLAGILDPATALGVEEKDTDFGETLHVWGAGEGRYMELPLLGPSTDRDTIGRVVDYAMNPVRILVPSPESYVGTAASVASRIGDRGRYSDTVDSVLYDSADSYAQARLLYLQNRRFELGQASGDVPFEDPYEDPYAE